MKILRKQYIYHIIGGIVFLFLPLILSPRPPEEIGPFFSRPTLRDLFAHILMLLFFYFNYYVLIKRLYFREKYLNYALIIILGFVLIIVLPSFLTGYNMLENKDIPQMIPGNIHSGHFMPPKPAGSPFLQEVRHHIYLFAVVILFSVLLQVNNRLLRIDKERVAAELAHLKAQIHPHFLFNTLNSIYALAIRKDDKAPDSIVKLSMFMRYLLKDANESEVALEKEIDYISNYLELQVSRLRDSVRLHYRLEGESKGKKIAPLLLFSFIENAFKHGVNPDEDSEIDIRINIDGDLVQLSVRNKTVKIRGLESSTNIGLANTKERLQLYYPNRHTLDIERTPDYFNVQLSIQLT